MKYRKMIKHASYNAPEIVINFVTDKWSAKVIRVAYTSKIVWEIKLESKLLYIIVALLYFTIERPN